MLQVSRSKNPIQQKLNVENYSTFTFQKVKGFVAIVRFNAVPTSLCYANIQAVLNSFTYLFKECVEGLSSFFTVIVFVLWERNAQSVIGCNPACITCCMLTFFVAYFTICLRVPITQPGTLSFFLIMERRLEKECEHKMQQ